MKKAMLLPAAALMLASLACAVTGALDQAKDAVIDTALRELRDEFPLVQWLDENRDKITSIEITENGMSFQADMEFDLLVPIVQVSMSQQGLTERPGSTVISESTASFIFDGHESGDAMVVQLVDLGNGMTSVNITFE
jgi:hypothetical protein